MSWVLLFNWQQLKVVVNHIFVASRVLELHNSWEQTIDSIDRLARQQKNHGQEVNLIYSTQSWFDKSRHLDRLRYDRLVEWDPGENKFITFKSKADKPRDRYYFVADWAAKGGPELMYGNKKFKSKRFLSSD